ncbi:Holliday junction branch migration protein RuvA [Alicyclobacillus cycloheptanicus]|uniref:Holliday junction branch migration complex subunit RuvA n=1 Tax=Alicyclobacillus cycloheptanicus TaxID=1457 RepID=A0ABT9XEL3_9BACL|nr:Holliday junction branch migration protein RuvA [Alicyclobacillus cycloheptanicus]MDQ0188742.1 Holliday junction DNA helicase RuvA [Alicyclobacillus cycloheptanicus]WDM00597.1 Holliday junction branch migration protein RuvA [Alicyclobacillus cycloheptanicus]
MISFLRGSVHQCGQGYVELDVAGVGYRVWMPERMVRELEAVPLGQNVMVYTHYHVREDAAMLFGFLTQQDRDWFELLIGVSGIGPKVALQLMSGTEADAFAEAVQADDISSLCALPGIGKKTAQRLVLELRDKLDVLSLGAAGGVKLGRTAAARSNGTGQPLGAVEKDIIEALVVLGYNEKHAGEVLASLLAENEIDSVEEGLKLALQQLAP